jgi:protocatechuate 3,4-dioxygenase beta subunit
MLGAVAFAGAFLVVLGLAAQQPCVPTRPDALGPFYRPGAPVRASVGRGYVLSGRVLGAPDCRPVPGARLEFWLAGPDGRYGDAYRATVVADPSGAYRFESHFPPGYGGRPPHIHVRVTAPGYRVLVTQHYPRPGTPEGRFDLVLEPET